MADTSPLTVVTNQIIALLVGNGSTFFAKTFKPGNRFSKLGSVLWPVTPPPAARNIPRIIIDCPDISTPDRNAMKTFTNVRSAVGDVVVRQQFGYVLTAVFEGVDRALANQLEYYMSGVLLADPRLGLTTPIIATSGQMRARLTEENSETTGGTDRLVMRTNFPVTIELRRTDLVAAAAYTGA